MNPKFKPEAFAGNLAPCAARVFDHFNRAAALGLKESLAAGVHDNGN